MRKILILCMVLVLGLAFNAAATIAPQCVNVDIYANFATESGGGAPYSNFVGSFKTSDVNFPDVWDPYSLGRFGALVSGCLSVAEGGNYTFATYSDDGSMFYIDNALVVDNGGPHGPQTQSGSTNLTAGIHQFKIEFYEDFGYPSVLQLSLPTGVSYTCCPVPISPSWLLLGSGLLGLVGWKRRQA